MLVGKNKQFIRSFEEHKSETIDILIIGTARERANKQQLRGQVLNFHVL